MPLLTTLIDDKSPLILYDDTWVPGTSADNSAMDYYLGTFTVNSVTDATVTFNFNGTQVWIYGAHRPNHGTYTIQLDSASYPGLNGDGTNAFQVSLFNTSVGQGSHSLTLTNTGSGNNSDVDIDLIVWQSDVGNAGDQLVHELVQDTDPRFQYQEPAWTTDAPTNTNFNYFYNGTGHSTSTYDASVTLTFTVRYTFVQQPLNTLLTGPLGEAMSLYGTTGPDNGPYSAQLDGGQAVKYNASNIYPTNYAIMLYHADNLGSGSHQLVLTNLPASSGQSLSIDYAEVWSTSNGTSTSPSPSTTNSPQNLTLSSSNLSSGAIAGIAIVVAVAFLCALAGILFYRRRWKAALATQQSFYRLDAPQPQPPEVATVAPTVTGVSSSIETRSAGGLYRNDVSSGSVFGVVHQPANNRTTQYYETVPLTSNSRDPRSLIDTSSPPINPPIEALGQRPLPGAPGGGMSLSAEFPKLVNADVRSESPSPTTAGRTSPAMTELPPPNYSQAIGDVASRLRG